MDQHAEMGPTIRTFDGDSLQLNGVVMLEFVTDGERGAVMRNRLAAHMPGLIYTYQLLDIGAYAIVALRDVPRSLAEFAQAWSTAGAIAERILNSTLDPDGQPQEPFHARLNPEGAAPDARAYLGHDPDVFRVEDSRIEPLDWRSAMRETPMGWGPETTGRKWSDMQVRFVPPENEG